MKNPKPFLEFAWRIELTLRVMKTFSVDHPRVDDPLAGAVDAFRDLVSGKLEIQIVAAPGRLFINDEPLELTTDINVAHLHQQMGERQVAGVVLGRGLEAKELRVFLGFLSRHPQKAQAQGGAAEVLGRAQVRHIKLSEVRYEAVKSGEAVTKVAQPAEQARFRRSQGLPLQDSQYEALRLKIQETGLSVERLEEYLGLMTWDHLDQAERLKLVLDGDRIFEVPPDFIQEFLRDLLDTARLDAFAQVMAHLGKGLFADSSQRRLRISEEFVGVAALVRSPGLPKPLELELAHLLRNHFAQEKDPKHHQCTCEALAIILGCWLDGGDLAHLNTFLQDLGGSPLLWVPGTKQWKGESIQKMLNGLAGKDHLVNLLPTLYESRKEELMKGVFPLLTRMGEPAARTLLAFLDGDTTQSQRRRLIDAIRAIGAPAIPPLMKSLEAPRWHLVRNAINTLRDLGAHTAIEALGRCLFHPDVRVRAAAARALRDMGGGTLLLEAFPKVPPDTQAEVAMGLGQLHYLPAVPAIAEVATGRGPLPHRIEAIKALGLMGSVEGTAVLAGLLKAKGLLVASEPVEIRLAAARALKGIASPEALEQLDQAIASAHGEVRHALLRLQQGKE